VEAVSPALPWPAAWLVVGLGLGWLRTAFRALRPPGPPGGSPAV
jgi:hypothetical protein